MKIQKAINKSKIIESTKSIKTRIKYKVLADLGFIFQVKWLQEEDTKNLINCVIDSTISKLSEEENGK